ncbi:MAG TPA: sialate O-acetylesterase [Capsulimonadaceae bacterium]|jgi:sialate O-acetylesterase
MRRTRLLLTLGVVAIFVALRSAALASNSLPLELNPKPYLASIFTSNMVLQREMRNPVWGWTTPGAKVTVEIAGDRETATAGNDGAWKVLLKKLPVGGPYEMVVTGPTDIHLTNVMSGDVWICSGQSNMEVGINAASNTEQEAAAANYPDVRVFKVRLDWGINPKAKMDDAQWSPVNPRMVWGISAVGYFFARDLYNELKIPIGLIDTDWGGTTCEAWTSSDALSKMPDFNDYLQKLEKERKGIHDDSYERAIEAWCTKNEPPHADFTAATFDDSAWKEMKLPAFWQLAGLPDATGEEWKTTRIVWFRRVVDVPESAAGKDAVLHLGKIIDADATYVNGLKVGEGSGIKYNGLGFGPSRNYVVPASALHAGKNVIAIRVLNSLWRGGICGKPDQMRLSLADGSSIDLTGAWRYCPTLLTSPEATPLPKREKGGVNATAPTTLFNAMVAPLIPYGVTGAVWYQGESNADRAYQYRTLLPAMIGDWRSRWGQGDFPFYIVQLANFAMWRDEPKDPADATWPELREAQALTAAIVPNCGLATTIDIGEAENIHPHNKQEVGRRLMLIALARHYGKPVVCSGPTFKSSQAAAHSIRIRLEHVDGGLAVHGEKLTGFAIAGDDKHFVWADATVDGDSVIVSSPSVAKPVAVRYAWANNPTCNLFNGAGLPAVPFRTDDWPGLTWPKPTGK